MKGIVGKASLILGVFLVLLPGQTLSQELNWRATPTYTTVNLTAGFTPDPWTYELRAGGSTRVPSGLGHDCRGWVHASAPDVDLNYTSGHLDLHIRVRSHIDTTLIVYDASGRWHCNDDAIGLDPVVTIRNPPGGNYNIWVGTYRDVGLESAQLQITEISPY